MEKTNFSEIFSNLYAKHGKELEKMRKELFSNKVKDVTKLLTSCFQSHILV